MNYLDIILGIILGFAALRGFRKGFILEMATFVALFLGIWAGFYFAGFISGWLETAFDYTGKYINVISFLIIFVSVIIVVQLLARSIEKSAKLLAMGLLNKITGAFFAVIKTLFILSILIYFLNRLDENHRIIKDEPRKASGLFTFTESIAPALMPKMKEYTDLVQQSALPENKAEAEE